MAFAVGAQAMPMVKALAALTHVACRLYASAEEAHDVWLRGDAPLPHVAFLAVADPGLARAAELLQARGHGTILIGVYEKGGLGPAVALLRAGFHDCLQAPLETSDVAAVVRHCLAERSRARAHALPGPLALDALTALLGERDALRAGERAAALLSAAAPQAIVVAGRCFPGGEEYTPPAELWQDLARHAPASLTSGLPASFSPATAAEAHELAPGVLLLRAGRSTPPPSPQERLAGAVLALVFEASGLRENVTAPAPTPAGESSFQAFLAQSRRVGHDINNPLCAIALNAQLLAIEVAGFAKPRTIERIRTIEESARKIEALLVEIASARLRAASELPVGA